MQATGKNTAAITLLSQLRIYAGYALWCNQRMAEWLSNKPAEILERHVTSSFSSIKETVVHMRDIQRFWLENLRDQPHTADFKQSDFDGSVADAFKRLLQQSEELAALANELTEESMQQKHQFLIPGRIEAYPACFDILQHLVTHDCYHRGQLVTIAHQLGFHDAPMTTYTYYCITTRKVQSVA
ncbi:MAG: DinB family protein [Flavipsychrobacter sp.]